MRFLGLAVLCLLGCGGTPATAPAGPLRAGRYSGDSKAFVGFFQVDARDPSRPILRVVITEHLPPAEVVTHHATLVERDGKLCLDPAPTAIAPCFLARTASTLTIRTREGETIVLERPPGPP
ncbi:MAG: hypothetical protein IT370_04830 [Deltaproteobacteria bacterium]|nr:hypothetical protein [Deltaproteobacteria bacterium]